MSGADRQSLVAGVDPWIRLGLLGALLMLSVFFVHVPASVWAGNVSEFHFTFGVFVWPGLIAVVAGLAVALLVLWLLPRRARAPVACLLAAIGLIWWIYGTLLVGSMTVLNGQDAPMDFETGLGVWELALVGSALLLLALAIGKLPRPATVALLLLNVGLGVMTTAAVLASRGRPARAPLLLSDLPAFRYSPKQNVLVVLLDGLQADVADLVLRKNPTIRAGLDGFQFYKETLGVAPTTFLSLPAIHSGDVYRRPASVRSYFERSIRERSFMNRFADAGFESTLVNPIEGICPDKVTTCTSPDRILRSRSSQLRIERLRLVDLSLFRVSPVWLKAKIYRRGSWLAPGPIPATRSTDRADSHPSFDTYGIFDGIELFRELARRFELNDGTPTLKFVHSFATHTPYVLADDCRTIAAESLDRLTSQARCALSAVVTLLDRLKDADVYDNTVILILADHGVWPGRFHDQPGSRDAWRHLAGAANPMFLLKLRNQRGPLRNEPDAVHLADVAATLCAATGACTAPSGIPVGQAPPERRRRFNEYVWNHEYWSLRDVPHMTPYEVLGPLWRAESWQRVE